MMFSSYIHEQLAAAHRRDLLEAAERARLIARVHEHRGERQRFQLRSGSRAPRRRAAAEPRPSASASPTATR
jgi:hypothetical protein